MCAHKCSVRCDDPTDVPWDNVKETLMPIGETCIVWLCVRAWRMKLAPSNLN